MAKDHERFIVTAYSLFGDGTKHAPSALAGIDWLARLPEREEITFGKWYVPATDVAAIVILSLWGDRIVYVDNEAKVTLLSLVTRFVDQTNRAEARAKFKINGIMPTLPDDWHDHSEHPLNNYQVAAVATSLGTEADALFSEQGTGKTPMAIRRLMIESMRARAKGVMLPMSIVVCPKNVRMNWEREIIKFATVPGKVTVLRGDALARMKQIIEAVTPDGTSQFSIIIASYDAVQRSWDALSLIEWLMAVCDESHMLKSPWAKRSKNMLMLRDRAEMRVIMTGTPMANGVLDLFYQLEFLGTGQSGFASWKAFRSFYERYAESENEGKLTAAQGKLIGWQNLPVLQERLARMAFTITKKEALPFLPSKLPPDVIEAEWGKQQRGVYDLLAQQLAVEIEDALNDSGGVMTVQHVLTKLLRLSQVTAGYMTLDADFDDDGNPVNADRVRFFSEVPKMDALIDALLEKSVDEKTIVWCCWIPAINEISRRMTAAGIKHVVMMGKTKDVDRELAMQSFNENPETMVFLGNPAAGGVGVNLPGYSGDMTTNASHTIYYAMNWSMIQRTQSEDRNHGLNRNRVPVRYSDLVLPRSIDIEIMQRVLSKREFANAVQDVREIMQRLLDNVRGGNDDE